MLHEQFGELEIYVSESKILVQGLLCGYGGGKIHDELPSILRIH